MAKATSALPHLARSTFFGSPPRNHLPNLLEVPSEGVGDAFPFDLRRVLLPLLRAGRGGLPPSRRSFLSFRLLRLAMNNPRRMMRPAGITTFWEPAQDPPSSPHSGPSGPFRALPKP